MREKRRETVARFDRIAPSYDRLNRILSLGLDIAWRRAAVRAGGVSDGQLWLDVAAGSGDMIAAGLRRAPGSRWIALDPSAKLLALLERRGILAGVPRLLAAAEEIPLAGGSVDGVTVAFGLRNFADRRTGLRELRRVLRGGGVLVLLEFHPGGTGGWGAGRAAGFYLEHLLPRVGGWISGDREAYRYLSESAGGFWTADRLVDELRAAGFGVCKQRTFTGGAVTLTVAEKTG